LTKLLRDNYLTLVVIRNVSLAYFARVGPYLAAAETSNSSLAKAAAASVREYLALLNKTPGAVPLYYTAPDSYRGRNVLIACVMYDWRSAVNLTGELRLYPGREWWAASYPMGHSKVAKAVATAKADMFKYIFGTPPPPPPVNLSGFVKQWRVPWNNRTLPYTPYYSSDMKMPPTDNETGIPLWNIQNLEDIQMTQSNVLAWLFTVLFITILSIVAVFEFLGAIFEFPTPVRAVFSFVLGVIQDWTYWLPFRIAVRGKLLLRIWLAVKRPVMRTTVRTAARVHSFFATRIPGLRRIRSPDLKEYYKRYVLWRREIAIKDPADQIREEVKTKAKRDALERVKKAAEERADAEWVRNWRRRAEEERTRREKFEKIRRIFNAGDIIEVLRELSPRFDMWVQEKVEMSRGSWSYHLFWWRQDRLPYMWRVLLNLDPHVVTRLVAEGKVKPEDAALYLNLRAAVEGYMREMRWGWARLHTVSQYVEMAKEEFERARQRMVEEAEKGLADFRRFTTEFQRRYEALRLYFSEDLSKLDEKERRQLEEAVKSVTERLSEAIRHFAVIDKAPRARIVAALNEALQRLAEGKAPQIPRDASVQDVVKHLALMDFDTAVKVLRSAERYLEAHYAVAPTRYDTREIAAEVVKWKIEEQLPTLKLAGAARGIVLGGRSAEEGEALLKAWGARDVHGERWAVVGGRFRVVDVYEGRPWEAVEHRFSYIHERPLDAREAVRIKSDVVLTAEYAKYLAGYKAEDKALEVLRKAVEYSRIERMLERAEELRLTPQAVERLTADAERLRREVLHETTEIFRRFQEEFFFVKDLLEGHRVVRREVGEVREVVKAFEEALTEALKAPGRRERVFREAFTERVERLVEEYTRRQDVEAVERIRRAAAELAKISEAAGWRAVEDVSVVLPAVGKAFEEALRTVGQSRDIARLAEAFKARAEEAAKQLEQQGVSDVARRVRSAAEKIAEEVYAGGWGAVERLRPLLSPERAGEVLGRLEFLHSLFATEALETYRGLVYLRQVEELAREVKGPVSAPGVAEEVLRRTAEAVPSAKDDVEKAKAALRAGRLAEAAEALGRVEDAASWWRSQNAETVEGVRGAVVLGREAVEYGRRVSELASRAGTLEGEAARLLSSALEALQRGEYGQAAKQLEAVERALGESPVLRLVREAQVEAEGLARAVEKLAEALEKAPSPELERALETVRRGEVERAREILTRIEAAGAAEEVVKAVREAKSLIPAVQPEEKAYALALVAAGVSGFEAAAVKTALEAAAGRNYSRALALTEAVEKAANERLAAARDVEPVAKTLEHLGLEPRRLSSPEYREQAVRELEKAAESLRSLADLATAVQHADVEKVAKAAEVFGLAETAALFRAVEKVRKEAGDVYPVFIKALTEALKAPEGERAETFRRVFTSETEKVVKVFEERGLKTEAENVRRAAEAAVKAAESIAWKAPEEAAQRLHPAVEEAEKLIVKLRDEAVVRQVAEYGYYSALTSLAREAGEVIAAKRDVEARLAKLIEDVKPAVERIAPHLAPLLERVKAGDYSVLPALEAELPKLAEQQRQLDELVKALGKAKESLEAAAHIDKKARGLEKALKKTPEDVKAVFDEAFKALKVRDFERAVAELDKILKIIEEKRARLEPLEGRIREARALAEQLGLEKVVKALERPTEKNASKALGELERELARLYGVFELAEYIKQPRADADFGHAWAVARVLGLEEADRLFKALSEASLYLLREGREIFRNPLYDEVKHLIDQEHVRALVKAPLYSYIIDRLGPDVLQPVYARWYGFFTDYSSYLATAFEHAKTSAMVARAPVSVTGGFSYAGKMLKWLGDFSQEAVARGLKAYYRGEGRGFRELSEMTVAGAKIQLFDKAASLITAKAAQMLSEANASSGEAAKRHVAEAHELKILASVLRAKAAYEEVRLVQTYLKGAQRRAEALLHEAERERDVDRKLALEAKAREMLEAAQRKAEKHLADARVRYRAYLAEVRDFVKGHDVREVGMKYFGLTARAFVGDPQEVAEKMIRAVDVRRVISWADELKLPKELGEIAIRIADAERVYNKFEKILRAKAEPIPPVYDLEKAGRFFSDARPQPPPPRSRLEEAVPKVVRDVLTAYYARLREAAERAAVYLALVKNDTRHASQEVKKAYRTLQKALKARDKEQALKALEELKAALKALGVEAEGEDVKTVLKAVEEKTKRFYEEYLNAKREYVSAVEAVAKFSPEAALALGEAARESGLDSMGRWMSLVAYETGRRALEGYARFWARPVEERWDALPPAVREAVARREEEAVYELVQVALKSAGIGMKKGVEMNLEGFEKALERVFTANGEWPELRDYVKQVIEAARRVQRGETSTEELEKAVDELFRAYGARAAERFVRSDRLEDAVAEMHEGMRHYARGAGLKVGREAAERTLLFGLSVMPEDVVEWYARDGWRGRLEPYVAYWTEDERLARRAGEAGWEVRQIQRPVSFEEGVPKEWRTAYVVAPFGFDLSAVERSVVEYVDGAREGVARVRPVEWPVPEAYLWFILKDRQPVREGGWITAYSIDKLSIEEPLTKFGEALRGRNFDEMRKAVRELYEARLNRTLWQIVYEFDRERAEAVLEHLRQRYDELENRLWERHDELYLTWLAFRLADEYADYLRSGVGRGFRAKEEVAGVVFMPWLPVDLAPLFWLRLVGDPEGEVEFRAAWYTAVDMWFERMAAPHTPKKPAVARKAVELFNAFVGAGFKYEELFPPPPPKPEAAKPAQRPEVVKPEAVKPAETKKEAVKPETAKPETKPAERLAQKPAVEVQRSVVEERGLRREIEKPAAKPEPEAAGPAGQKPPAVTAVEEAGRGLRQEVEKPTAKPETVKPAAETKPEVAKPAKPEAVKPAERPAEVKRPEAPKPAVEGGLIREKQAPIANVIPERVVEAVDYLIERFGLALDRNAAFKAKSLVTAKVQTYLEKVAVKEPEFAHILAEAAEHVLSSFGRLLASPDAARHVHEALFYYFEGYQTRDGEVLYARIERTVREAVRKAEEAGIPDAEHRIKQFVLWLIERLEEAGERYRKDALKAISTVEKTLRTTALAGLSTATLYSVYHGLYSEAVLSSVATAVAFAEVGQFKEAVQYVQKAAKALYDTAKDVFEHVKVTVQRLVELFVEAVTRMLAWVDEHRAYLFLMAAVTAGAITLSTALNLWGLIELEKLAYAAMGAPFFAGLADTGEKAAERFGALAERWKVNENEKQKIEEVLNAPQNRERPYEALLRLAKSGNLPEPLVKLKEALENARNAKKDERMKDAAVVAALVLYKTLVKNAEAYGEWARWYERARSLVKEREFTVKAEEVKRLRGAHRRLEEVAEQVRRELNAVLALYKSHSRDLYEKLKPHLEVDLGKAEELAEARRSELSNYSDANMGTKAYAALLSVAKDGIYGHAAMLLTGEGALADVALLTPRSAYDKAKRVAKRRGESVDPFRSPKGAVDWEERAASTLLRFLIGYGEADLKFRRVEKGKEKGRVVRGFQVFRAYGGVEAPVGELWIGEVTYFKVDKEGLRHLVEEAKETVPDLSGFDKAPQYLEWRATDVTTSGERIAAATAHSWQLRWYFGLLGGPKSFSGWANVTKEGIKPVVIAFWPRENEDQILRESRWLESLLGRRVESWHELVDAVDWSWVLEKVGELAGKLRPWIGPEKMGDDEREGLARRMLGELALLAHFAEARRGMDDDRWREERVKRLSRAVEALSGGRITGDYAERLAELIILYAERREERAKERIDKLAEELAGVSKEEVRGIVRFVLGDMHCLVRDCARDEVVRKFVAPALELIMLDKALNGKFSREEALLRFGEMYATAVAGDGTVGPDNVKLVVGGELGGGAALLRLAALRLLDQLLPDERKFGVRTHVVRDRYYYIAAYGGDAARLMRLLAVSAPSAGEGYLSPKFDHFVEAVRVEVRPSDVRRTKSGVAADLTLSEAGIAVKYNVYLRNKIVLEFHSTDRSRAELAARLLKLAGVSAELKKKEGGRDEWYVKAATDRLAAGREELRDAIAEIVRKAVESGWVDAGTAERWLE
ncbi:MAG: hypothetical protein ACO2PN_07050, partial [Pyrobaculum sp.]